MKEFEIPPFYVGQEIVAVKKHSGGCFKKGDEFIVNSCRKSSCGCTWDVEIGILVPNVLMRCHVCGDISPMNGEAKFDSTLFAPKIQLSDFISMKQLAETQLETIGAN